MVRKGSNSNGKKPKKYGRENYHRLSHEGLIEKKSEDLSNLEINLTRMERFAQKERGPILSDNFWRWDGNVEKYSKNLMTLNLLLGEEERLDLSNYNKRYEEVCRIVEEKNRGHIDKECRKLLGNYNESGLMQKAGLSVGDVVTPTISVPSQWEGY